MQSKFLLYVFRLFLASEADKKQTKRHKASDW